jgi:hypothetical protein
MYVYISICIYEYVDIYIHLEPLRSDGNHQILQKMPINIYIYIHKYVSTYKFIHKHVYINSLFDIHIPQIFP